MARECGSVLREARRALCSRAGRAVERRVQSLGAGLVEEACRRAAPCLGLVEECRPLYSGPEDFGEGSVGLVRWFRALQACLARCVAALLGAGPARGRAWGRAWRAAVEGDALALYWLCYEAGEYG